MVAEIMIADIALQLKMEALVRRSHWSFRGGRYASYN